MDELTEQILAEKENLDIALQNLKTAMARKEKTVMVPKSDKWHKDSFKGII